jgi:hypothetical protein
LLSEVLAENGIAVSQQVAGEMIEECVPQLLSRPLCGGMSGYVEVNNAAAIVGQ